MENRNSPLPLPHLHPTTLLNLLFPHSYKGYTPGMGNDNPKDLIAWSTHGNNDLGPIEPPKYTSPDIACHMSATPAPASAPCSPGSTISLTWNQWSDTHKGPVLDYLAPCNGPCNSIASPADLEFVKIDQSGLLGQSDGKYKQGHWASDTLIENGLTWSVKLPEDIAPGEYVLRHEIIALHSAHLPNGAQNYPQCITLKVGGSGTKTPKGVSATTFYTPQSVDYSVWTDPLKPFTIPGPALWDGASSSSSSSDSGGVVVNNKMAVGKAGDGGQKSGFVTMTSASAAPAASAAGGEGADYDEGEEGDECEVCEGAGCEL